MLADIFENLALAMFERKVVRIEKLSLRNVGPTNVYFDVRLAKDSKLAKKTPNEPTGVDVEMANALGKHLEELIWRNGLSKAFDHIAGVPFAADPFVEVLTSRLHRTPVRLKRNSNTKRLEDFATFPIPARNSTILLVENVTTTGKSAYEAAEFLEKSSYKVRHVLSIIDRQSGASELLGLLGIELIPLIRMIELLDFYSRKGKISPIDFVKADVQAQKLRQPPLPPPPK